MSSFFNSRQSKDRRPEGRRRSRSVAIERSQSGRVKDTEQIFKEGDDVATKVCEEIARAVMLNPKMDTGVFFNTVGDSRRDLNKSYSFIVISAAILFHIGNSEMAKRLLSKSSTCTKYFSEFGLDNPKIRAMFVTMMFSLNPSFVTMLEVALKVSLDRLSHLGKDSYSARQVASSIKVLHGSGAIDDEELTSIVSDAGGMARRNRRGSIQTTPTSMVHPDDSVTSVGEIPASRRNIRQKDVMEYLQNRKRGTEPDFYEVFPSASRPIEIRGNKNRAGLGRDTEPEPENSNKAADAVNAVFYNQAVPSYNLNTGARRDRPPVVSDLPALDTMSEAAAAQPTEVTAMDWGYVRNTPRRIPSPTEFDLPTSFAGTVSPLISSRESSPRSKVTLKRGSIEDINAFLRSVK